jgi:hypothetical protein
VLKKGGYALNPRGEFYTEHNIEQMLTMRAFMDELRGSGVDTGGPAAFSQTTGRILPTAWIATSAKCCASRRASSLPDQPAIRAVARRPALALEGAWWGRNGTDTA